MQTHLGVYMFAGGETALAQKCLLRARLLMLTVHGEDHPYTATLDVSFSAELFLPPLILEVFNESLLKYNDNKTFCFLTELSWIDTDRRSAGTVPKERSETQHLLLRPF